MSIETRNSNKTQQVKQQLKFNSINGLSIKKFLKKHILLQHERHPTIGCVSIKDSKREVKTEMRVFGCDMTVVWKVFSYRPTTQKPIQNFYRKEFCVSNPIRHQPQHRTQQYANQTRITLPRITFYAHQIRRFVYKTPIRV